MSANEPGKTNKFIPKGDTATVVSAFVVIAGVVAYAFSYPNSEVIIGAALGGGAHTIIRNLRLPDDPFVVMNYYAYFTGILSLIIIFLSGEQFIIISSDYYLLLILGLIAFFAQYFLTLAYRNTEASSISLYAYLQIIFCTIFGIILFHEIPDLFSIAGAILVIFSGYLNYKISIY